MADVNKDHKVIIIGGGPGGYGAAIRAAQLGLKPLLIEKSDFLGGTCLHRGCVPTKILLESASRLESAKKCADFGIVIDDEPKVNMEQVMLRKKTIVKRLAMGLDGLMKKQEVEVAHGFGKIERPGLVSVNGDLYEAENIILAVGSEVAVPPVFPVDGKRVLTSDHILEMQEIPESIIIAGSGAVGMEFASILSRLGSKVTVVEMLPRLLPIEDEEVSAEMQRIFRKKGITIKTGCAITSVEAHEDSVLVKAEGIEDMEASVFLAAAGRRAVLKNIGLEEAGIKIERGRIVTDEYLRTSVPGIYAIGDIIASPQLAHMATAEGIKAAEHIAGLAVKPFNYAHCPSAVYTSPEVASIGLTEAKARELGEVKVGKMPFAAVGKAAIIGETEGFVKIVADSKGKILGVHMVGPHVTEMIAASAAALGKEMTLEELAHVIHPHPALCESIGEAAHLALGQPLNFVPPAPRRAR
ncbi:MAG: dihydrolipoyl dehydrogenase [bacterium]|nr:dihydrolipoyl dehydrogenase [bacterium]